MAMPSRRLTPLVLAILLASAATMSAQDARHEDYLDLVLRYRAGEYTHAVEALARTPLDGLRERVDEALWAYTCRKVAGREACQGLRIATPTLQRRVHETWLANYPAALLLHLETIEVLFKARLPEGVNQHRHIVRDLLARMQKMMAMPANADLEGLAAFESFRRRGQVLFIWTIQGQLDFDAVEEHLAPMLRERPADPDLLLGNAWLSEFRARPLVLRELYRRRHGAESAPGYREIWLREQREHWLSLAERQYRRVLEVDSRNAEAHLRLGRVVALVGRADEARRAFQRAHELTEEPRLRYLARLFDAAAREDLGDAPGARESYDAALRVWPKAQSARLGLSRLRLLDRDYAVARDLLPRHASDSDSNDPRDPWAWYDHGQWWRVNSTFASMRAELRP